MIESIIFALFSAGILWFSWPSLRRPRSHGFFRFFAFEATLGLILLNLRDWFRAPFSWHQLISWVLLVSSLLLVIHGFYLLRRIGRPVGDFEQTTHLVRVGAYRYIRHPLYASLLYWASYLNHLPCWTAYSPCWPQPSYMPRRGSRRPRMWRGSARNTLNTCILRAGSCLSSSKSGRDEAAKTLPVVGLFPILDAGVNRLHYW
jgi:hypothetical protein